MIAKKWIKKILSIAMGTIISVSAGFGLTACKDEFKFTINDTLSDGQGKKAKVILLGGQSNASGCSRDDYLKKNVSAEKYLEYERGYDNVYINYFASGTNESKEFVKCATKQGEGGGFFGPELGLAEKLHELYPNEMFFIIKYAWGGSNLFEQWRAPSSSGKTGKMYRAFESFVETSLDYLDSKNYDVVIEGMCWMQGESDSFSVENATDYKDNLTDLIKDVRRKFTKRAGNNGIAFIDAYIADNPVFWVYCDLVNESKRQVAELSWTNVLIDTNAEGLSCSNEPEENPDIPHYDSMSQIKLGHLFAENVSRFFD
jgi:hypothetical protein